MTIRNLDALFQPKSIAVFGPADDDLSAAVTVVQNLRDAGFQGPVMPVATGAPAVLGTIAYGDAAQLPMAPDLALIDQPLPTVPGLIAELGRLGTRAVVILSGNRRTGGIDADLEQAILDAARPTLLRVLGPASVGLLAPHLGLNASIAHANPGAGKIAFVTQSRAMVAAVLEYATAHDIGFSHFVSLGRGIDVDVGDVLDHLSLDPATRAILIHAESIPKARKFMSAARSAARNKPVLVIKAGRLDGGARTAATHTVAMAGADDVIDAAIRRAGMLRVRTVTELFDAVETLARVQRCRGDRLGIVTNGSGPGVMAADALPLVGGRVATLSEKTIQALDAVLPPDWSRGNPVDILGDADAGRYGEALNLVLADGAVDAALFIRAPAAATDSRAIAEAAADAAGRVRKPVLACWLGGGGDEPARDICAEAGIPSYASPEEAVGALAQVVEFWRNQELLMVTPPSVADEFVPDVERAREIVGNALAAGRSWLTTREATQVLDAYAIPASETLIADTPDEAARFAEALGFPVAVKILSPDLAHKSDIDGVILDLATPDEVRKAADTVLQRLGDRRPNARAEGFCVQRMVRASEAIELIVGVTTDPVFGPVVLFGHGGTSAEVIGDHAVALPPLNMALARDLVGRTRVARLLGGYRDRPPVFLTEVHLALVKVAQLVADIPEIQEVDINPLMADRRGVIAVDARIGVAATSVTGQQRLAIKPYPKDLEERITFDGRTVILRPIRPEDEPEHRVLLEQLSPDDVRFRFFTMLKHFAHTDIARFTQIDYDREMAFIASATDERSNRETLGVARAITDPNNDRAEFAILVRTDLKGRGLGAILLDKLIRYCRRRGMRELYGPILTENRGMRRLAERMGFIVKPSDEDGVVDSSLTL